MKFRIDNPVQQAKKILKWHRLWRIARRVDIRKPMHAALIGVVIAGIAAPVLNYWDTQTRYRLDTAEAAVISHPSAALSSKLVYDDKKQANLFNPDGQKANFDGLQARTGDGKNTKNLYSATMPIQSGTGIEISDGVSGTSVTMRPQFRTLDGRIEGGRVSYPLKDNAGQLILTPKANGLKEDILLDHAAADRMQYDYQLVVPDSLEAKIMPDGGVGFYSGDPALFGNISYGSDKDRQQVELARKNAQKTYLMFTIPAPVVKQADGQPHGVTARFELSGDMLSVIVHGLQQASYPLSIDPSFVITSLSDFNTGRIEDNISVTTGSGDGQINRAPITGGLIDANGWRCTSGASTANCSTASTLPAGCSNTGTDYQFGMTAYNGYLYLVGGGNGATTYTCFVPINSDGTLGAWAAATNHFATGRTGGAVVGYNGYLYIIGGETANGGTQFTTVEYSAVQSNGDLGAWATTSATNTGRAYLGAAVYNDFIYICGGAASKNNGQLKDTCEWANVKADGTLGTWTQSTSSTTGTMLAVTDRMGFGAYNGYLYKVGGYTGSTVNTVSYVPIKSDGSLGTWVATTVLPAAWRSGGLAIEQGYIYIYAGCSTNPPCTMVATSVYAPVHADGSIGAWDTSASINTARIFNGSASYNGVLYTVGGCLAEPTNNNNCAGTEEGDSQYAVISTTPGDVVAPASGGTYSVTTRSATAVLAYNGYLYVAGGCNGTNCGTAVGTVNYAPLNDDGTVGTWSAGGSFPSSALRFGGAMVGFGGRIYYLGGETSAGTAGQTNVYSATLASGSPIWSAEANTFNTGRYWLAAAMYSNYMYISGGQGTGGPFNTTEYTQIDSNGHPAIPANCVTNGGTVHGSWCTSGNNFKTVSSISTRYGHGMVGYDGYLYIVGGLNGSTLLNDVQRASLQSADGYPGTWDDASQTALPTTSTDANIGHAFAAVAVSNSVLYVIGGIKSGTNAGSAIAYAPINSSGNVGSWNRSGRTLGTARWGAGGTSYDGMLYVAGGCTSNATTCAATANTLGTAEYAEMRNGGTGMTSTVNASTWSSQTTPALTARADDEYVAYNGFLYAIGGCTAYSSGTCSTWTSTNSIQKAPINADGSVGTWAATTLSLPTNGRAHGGAVAYNGRLYVVGGTTSATGASTPTASVIYTSISSSGDLAGSWTDSSGNYLPTARRSFGIAASSGYIYVAGGTDGTSRLSDVLYTKIDPSTGALTDPSGCTATNHWCNSHAVGHDLATTRQDLNLVAYNSTLYAVGGTNGGSGLGDTQYATLSTSDGSVGTFAKTTYMDRLSRARGAVAGNGYLYFLGTETSSSEVYYAAMNANGTAGNLYRASSAGMPTANHGHGGMAFYNGFLYAMGGCAVSSNVCGAVNNNVDYVGQKPRPEPDIIPSYSTPRWIRRHHSC